MLPNDKTSRQKPLGFISAFCFTNFCFSQGHSSLDIRHYPRNYLLKLVRRASTIRPTCNTTIRTEDTLMGPTIRRATGVDAPKWLELVQATLGDQYPAKAIYESAWIASQLGGETGHETWVAEADGRLNGSIS